MAFITYQEACKLMNDAPKTGNSKISQITSWKRHSCLSFDSGTKLYEILSPELHDQYAEMMRRREEEKRQQERKEREANKKRKYFTIDDETGEVKEARNVVELNPGDKVRRASQGSGYNKYSAARQKSQERAMQEPSSTDFVWIFYKYGQEIFPNVSAANLTRLMYLSTFSTWDGRLPNKAKINEMLGLKHSSLNEFWNEMSEEDVLRPYPAYTQINVDKFRKGNLPSRKSASDGAIRLFSSFVRQMYENCDSPKNHKTLSYVFKIIPWIDKRTNIVCFRPNDPNRDICIMNLGEFCATVGLDEKYCTELAYSLLDIRVNGEQLINFWVPSKDKREWNIVANPHLYYGGSALSEDMEMQVQLFENERRAYLDKMDCQKKQIVESSGKGRG